MLMCILRPSMKTLLHDAPLVARGGHDPARLGRDLAYQVISRGHGQGSAGGHGLFEGGGDAGSGSRVRATPCAPIHDATSGDGDTCDDCTLLGDGNSTATVPHGCAAAGFGTAAFFYQRVDPHRGCASKSATGLAHLAVVLGDCHQRLRQAAGRAV